MQGNVVDLWPVDAQGRVNFDPAAQARINSAMQAAAAKLGVNVRWGGLQSEGGANQSFRDAPNFQLMNPRPLGSGKRAEADLPAAGAQTVSGPFPPELSGGLGSMLFGGNVANPLGPNATPDMVPNAPQPPTAQPPANQLSAQSLLQPPGLYGAQPSAQSLLQQR